MRANSRDKLLVIGDPEIQQWLTDRFDIRFGPDSPLIARALTISSDSTTALTLRVDYMVSAEDLAAFPTSVEEGS